uniref:ABC transporter domain-containing protein n=1 Tax=Romanomermis culicivorax TaxID=13658 RepID=A0A915JNG5_ROMCU
MVKIVEEKLNDKFPLIDDEIKSYVLSIIDENQGEFTGANDIYDAIGDILVSASDGSASSQVDEFCRELTKILNISKKVDSDKSSKVGDRRLLTGPVSFSVENPKKEDDSTEANLWSMSRNNFSNADVKKLEKAESKLKNKQEKKIQNSNSSTKLASDKDSLASVNQPTNNSSSYNDFCTDIKLENFDMFFGDRKLLVDANMTLVFGRRYGLVGRNGLGKTTLLKMISTGNLKIPSRLTVLHVEQEVNGDDTIVIDSVLESDEKRHNLLNREKEIQRKLNNHEDHKSDAEQKQLAEELHDIYEKLTSIEADKAPARAASILVGLGFDFDAQKRPTKEFSGGWRMRLALARALFLQPDLLLLDEPTNMLDIKAIYWLENYLQNWKTTMLVVSHDRNFLNKISTDIILLRNQRLDHYSGDYDNFEKARAEKLKNEQREYDAQKQLREHVQTFIDRFRYNANRAALVQSKIKMLEKLPVLKPIETDADVKFDFPASERINATVLQLDEITFAYDPKDKSTLIFEKCDLNADADSRICIVGENGAGKTTLLKLLNGELEPTSGFRRPHRTLKIAYFTQHHVDQLLYDQNALQFIQTKFPGQTMENYRAALGRFGISGDLVFQPIASLSGGQKSRLAFSLICMQAPNFLILDEPTNHLDIESVEALGAALQKFEGGVILVSHDERLIELVCKELWLVKNKNVKRIEGGLKEYKKIIEQELAEMR